MDQFRTFALNVLLFDTDMGKLAGGGRHYFTQAGLWALPVCRHAASGIEGGRSGQFRIPFARRPYLARQCLAGSKAAAHASWPPSMHCCGCAGPTCRTARAFLLVRVRLNQPTTFEHQISLLSTQTVRKQL
jgi:hypothetical protein